jgi:hypothetical protein
MTKTLLDFGWIALLFEPRDIWVGVYWDIQKRGGWKELSIWICVLPTLPIRMFFVIFETGG